MKLALIVRLRRLQVKSNISPLRRLLSIGFPQKLAEKLILTGQNKEECHQRRRLACVRMYHYMVCRLPQRIFNMGQLLRQSYDTLYKISADMGCCDAAIYLGLRFMKTYNNALGFSHADTYYQMAVDYLETAAYQGNTEAQYNLGKMLLNRSQPKAKKWLNHAALKGNVPSQLLLGQLCGPTEEGNHWYRLAADQGSTEAQCILGCRFESSNKLDDAVSWFRLAALSNHFVAKEYLLDLLTNHPDLRQDAEMEFFKANENCHHMTLRKLWFERK